jgi:mannose-6-phosphate isomerase-like protein (cupin superfamily)
MRDGPGWRALELDEVEGRPWVGTELTWLPLREELGTRIVGMAAFTFGWVGQEVVEGHSEADGERGHEEVYIVLRGSASFTLDGAERDAPAGTFVLVSDPRVYRRAVADEPDTAVLALGGPATFEPSASEWIERARPYVRTDQARARRIIDEVRATAPTLRA